jgi:RHS repeat-associated protein
MLDWSCVLGYWYDGTFTCTAAEFAYKCSLVPGACDGGTEGACQLAIDYWGQPPPPEVCGNNLDDDCDGTNDDGCVELCGDTIDNDGDGYINEGCPELCDGSDNNGNGKIDEGCPEICGDGLDNNADGNADEGCDMPDAPPTEACFDPSTGGDALSEMNAGCPNGDWAGYDPIRLATRSATTEPFTDLEVTVLRSLKITRSYSSGDVISGGAAGVFGLGWHHEWETTLTCISNGTSCSVDTGPGERMQFAAQTATVIGVGAQEGETLVLYHRTEPENLAIGGHNLLVRRPDGEFILFQLDGSELHFFEPPSCGSYCMDASYNGTLRLSQDVDPAGRGVALDFTTAGKLLTLTDDLGNVMSLAPSGTCGSRAGALSYRPGTGAVDSTYVTYEYDSTCETLTKAVPANYTPAPGKAAQLRAYEYQATPVAGLLSKVRNEYDDPIVVFGYDGVGNATYLQDAQSSLTISYPQGNKDVVVSSYGTLKSTTTTYRDGAGKASTVQTSAGFPLTWDDSWPNSFQKMSWDGRYLGCSEEWFDHVRYFERDEHYRVTMVGDYGVASSEATADVHCVDSPWLTKDSRRYRRFWYGVTKPIAQGVNLSLDIVTKTWHTSVLGDKLGPSGGQQDSAFKTIETLDYDPASKSGDPSGYNCGQSTVPIGGVVCRKTLEGYTYSASNEPTLQKVGTFYTYDARGRLVRTLGPIYLVGTPPAGNVDPVEERTYWPDDDVDPLRRGRLHEVKRWPSGYPAATNALVTTYQLYDAFGPTQVIDDANGTTVYSRAGGAGRVTRVDAPDGRHVSTRYYDGEKPRLLLLHGGAARRFTYDEKGRLHVTEPLSNDPDAGPFTVGWTETREHDAAGNTTEIRRADAQGVLRWKQQFEHYPDGALRKLPHPDAAKGYARWTRYPNGVAPYYWDEDLRATTTLTDVLKRARRVSFGYLEDTTRKSLPGGFSYEYERWQDALSKVSSYGTMLAETAVIAAYVHDDFGRLLEVGSPATMTAGPYIYAYDARGNTVRRTGGGAVITWQYDGVDRVTQMTATRSIDGSTFTYTYAYDDPDAPGRLHTITEPNRTTTFTYDEVGRLRFEEVAESGVAAHLTTEYQYDGDGDVSHVVTPSGLDVAYERDPVTKEITEVRNVATGTKYATNIKHLPAGPITDLTFAGGAVLAQGFNLRYEPIAISSGPVALSYTVSGSGLVTAMGGMSFTYDRRGRLERAKPLYTVPYTYVYPSYVAGTSARAVNDRPAEVLDATGQRKWSLGYDDGSNLSAITAYDSSAFGGSGVPGTVCLVHDALGRLTAMGPAKVLAEPDARACKSENDLGTVLVRFRYDARNRRVARQDGTGPWKYYLFTSDGTPLAEATRPSTTNATWTFRREYVWLEGRPLAQIEYCASEGGPVVCAAGDNEGNVYLIHVDHLGQPRALTSTAGAVVWSASPPKPYGDLVEATAVDPANGRYVVTNLRLPGQYDERLLDSIGLRGPYYNHSRWYLPSMARYMELDPIALRGGINGAYAPDWYGYANANPLRWTDPHGEFWGMVVGGAFGALYGGFGAALTGGDWRAGAATGLIAGAIIGGLIDPTTSIGVAAYMGQMAVLGGLTAGVGSMSGQVLTKGPGNVSWWGVAGATIGGTFGGAFEGVVGYYGVSVPLLGQELMKKGVSGMAGMFGEMAGEGFRKELFPESTGTTMPLPYEAALGWALGCKQ